MAGRLPGSWEKLARGWQEHVARTRCDGEPTLAGTCPGRGQGAARRRLEHGQAVAPGPPRGPVTVSSKQPHSGRRVGSRENRRRPGGGQNVWRNRHHDGQTRATWRRDNKGETPKPQLELGEATTNRRRDQGH